MDFWKVLLDILVLLSAGLLLGALAEMFRQSAILGYLLAGTVVGPNALKLIETGEQVAGMAELGVALLLFSIGLEFSWRRLKAYGLVALGGGGLQVTLTLALASLGGIILGLQTGTAIVIGAVVSLSSTACVLRVLAARTELDSAHGRRSLGILLFQDLAVVPLVLLVGVLAGPQGAEPVLQAAGRMLLTLAGLVVGFYVVFDRVVPLLISRRVFLHNRELPVLLAVVAGLGSAWVTHSVGLSPAIGAFLAGMLLAESPFATQVRSDVSAVRTVLMTLFFSSVGMLADPSWILSNAGLVLAAVATVVVGKAAITALVLRVLRQRRLNSLAAGICLAQIGEFSFVLVSAAGEKLVPREIFLLCVATMIVTLFLTPLLIAGALPTARLVERVLAGLLRRSPEDAPLSDAATVSAGHVVVVGYGPAGKRVGRFLREQQLRASILDFSPRLAQAARELGHEAHIGDARHPETLEALHPASAAAVVVTVPDPTEAATITALVRSMAPEVPVVARARYNLRRAGIEAAGATVVVDEEEEVGAALAARLHEILES